MKKMIFISIMIFPILLLAQEEIGIKANLGVSYISNTISNNELGIDNNNKAGVSANLGLFYNFNISPHSLIAFEISYMRIESREVINGVVMMDKYGRLVAYGNSKIRKRLSYLALPIYYGFKFSKWSINAGFQLSAVLSGSKEVQSESEFYKSTNEYDLLLNTIDYGPRIGFTWKLAERIDLEATYYYGLSNTRQDNRRNEGSEFWNVQQLTFGVRYALYQN